VVSNVNIDKSAPFISYSRTPANPHGWNNTDVTISFACSDALSGLAPGNPPGNVTLQGEGAGQSVDGACMDQAGNVSSISVGNINIDRTAPTLSPSVTPNPVQQYGTATATAGAVDNLSGIDTQSCDVPDTSIVGIKTVNCTATDKAGNSSSATVEYTVNSTIFFNFTGFFPPVDNPPTLNVVKAGSAIPVKFSLGGYQGLNIFKAGYPISQKVNCDTSAPVDDIEQTVPANSSSLSYDASVDRYNYVWKTDKSWTGTCRQFVIIFIDGNQRIANFKFK
jgi:hypothetical protein